MAVLTDLLIDPTKIHDVLQLDDQETSPFIINHISDVCLAKFVELTFNNKFGEPLVLTAFQRVMLHMLWTKKFPMVLGARGMGKTFMLAVYCVCKALLVPGCRIVVVSGGFRQAKFVFGFIDELIKNSPILQESLRKVHGNDFGVKYATDKVYIKVGHNTDITGIPIGDGSKVRGLRATILVCDEVASIADEVFDTAIGPFLSVHANPAESVMLVEFIEKLQRMKAAPHIIKMVEAAQNKQGNQLILSGTATYQFNHFYRRYCAYMTFAQSGGDRYVIKEGLQLQAGEKKVIITEDMLDMWEVAYKEYAIFQLPYEGMPRGFLDEVLVATHKAIMDPVIFGHEYQCRFSKDTMGFFPRSIIEHSSPKPPEPNEVHFELYGDPHGIYVMGLDPARWNDNFGLVVLKVEGGTARLVYCDSWRKEEYGVSVTRIRQVMARFPNIVHIAMDTGGGGYAVQEMLANAKLLEGDERPVVEFEPDDKYRGIPNALKILEMINFHTWAAPANHSMKGDITLQNLLFPCRLDDDRILLNHSKLLKKDGTPFDHTDMEDAVIIRHLQDLLYGTETDENEIITAGLQREFNSLIDEVCTIIQTTTEKGSETFGLPKLMDQSEGLDIRRRDRYSALLLAAHAAREVRGHGHPMMESPLGGTPSMILREQKGYGMGYKPMQRKGGVYY